MSLSKAIIKSLIRGAVRRVNPAKEEALLDKPLSSVFGLDRGQPIDRFYTQAFLNSNAADVKGVVYEIAEDRYASGLGNKSGRDLEVRILSYASGEGVDVVGDLTRSETLPSSSADCFICTQTLNFIYDLPAAIKGLRHILKPGGVLLLTVSGISQISRYDEERWGDFWRFTPQSLSRLFESFGDVHIQSFGNSYAAAASLRGLAVEDLPHLKILEETDTAYPVILGLRAKLPETP